MIAYKPIPKVGASHLPRLVRLAAPGAVRPLAYDVWESQDALVILVDLPGVDDQRVALSLGSEALYLNVSVPSGGEPRSGLTAGEYELRVEVAVGGDPDAIDASLAHGLLRIRISKANSGTRRMPISSDDSQG